MNINEAIEIKSRKGEEFLHTDPDKIEEADNLSIEALKRVMLLRSIDTEGAECLLYGETKD